MTNDEKRKILHMIKFLQREQQLVAEYLDELLEDLRLNNTKKERQG